MTDGLGYTPGAGAEVATDDCGAAGHTQIVKLAGSADGDATLLTATPAGGLMVTPAPTAATITNGSDVAVSTTATQVLAANTARVGVFAQNVGNAPVRIGLSGVTATSGICQLAAGEGIHLGQPFVPTAALFAIATTTTASAVLCAEVTA